MVGMEDLLEQTDLVVGCRDVRRVEEWELNVVSGAVDDEIRVDGSAVYELDRVALQFGDVGFGRDAAAP